VSGPYSAPTVGVTNWSGEGVGPNVLFAWLISHQPAVFFSQNKPANSNQLAVLFSQKKPAPAISHQPTEQAASPLERRSICRRSNPCNGCPPYPFIDARGGAQGERKYELQCLVTGDVPSCVVVRQDTLKQSCVAWSRELPRGQAGLFTSGRLAPLVSSLLVSRSARVLD
jgi:hypothetical protein